MSTLRGLCQASLDATKEALTGNVEDWIPPTERYIFNFISKEELKKWHLYSDSEFGDNSSLTQLLSSASLEINGDGNKSSGNSQWEPFPGCKSRFKMENNLERLLWNEVLEVFSKTLDFATKWFDGFIDWDAYDTIALKLKGDGRSCISTIYTANWVNSPGQLEDNSWQFFVFVPRDNWGNVIDGKLEMNPSRILGMHAGGGFPGAKSGRGGFRFEIDWIKALQRD